MELLRNLDNYQRIVEGAYGYGQQRLQETLGLDDEAIYELDGYMDFEEIRSGMHGKRLRDKNRVRPAASLGPALPGADAGAEDDVSKSGSIHLERAA